MQRIRLTALGPGIIFAAGAIGVSHLVQSTRAGASYGLAMTGLVLLVVLLKYPVLRFGMQYPAATGRNLMQKYLELSPRLAVVYLLYLLLAAGFLLAVITWVTAGILQAVLGLSGSFMPVAIALLGFGSLILIWRGYVGLERLSIGFVTLLFVLMFTATGLAMPKIDFARELSSLPEMDAGLFFFMIAVAGWMPTPVDGIVGASAWSADSYRLRGAVSARSVRLDFNVGYVISLLTALCFVVLGAAVMHGPGIAPEAEAPRFAQQVIGLFTENTGGWAYSWAGVAVLATMLSTFLAALDVYPRLFAQLLPVSRTIGRVTYNYLLLLLLYATLALFLLMFAKQSFASFIDLVTTVSFIAAPVVIYLNHRAITDVEVPEACRPNALLRLWSIVAGLVLGLAAVAYLVLRISDWLDVVMV